MEVAKTALTIKDFLNMQFEIKCSLAWGAAGSSRPHGLHSFATAFPLNAQAVHLALHMASHLQRE